MFSHTESTPRMASRIRAFGKARLDIANRAQTPEDWQRLWKPPVNPFPFTWGQHWRQCVEYRVSDFAAEVGFWIDVLGLPVNAFNSDYAMLTSPNHDFYFSVVAVPQPEQSTPPDAFRLQFMVEDIFATTQELSRRGVGFEVEPQPVSESSMQWAAAFRTPHGILVEIWGLVEMVSEDESQPISDMQSSQIEVDHEVALEQPLQPQPVRPVDTHLPAPRLAGNPAFQLPPVNAQASAAEEFEDIDLDEDEEDYDPEPYVEAPAPTFDRRSDGVQEAGLKTFTSGQDMLEHLKHRKAPQHPSPAAVRPAPKKQSEQRKDSIWDRLTSDVEYEDLDSQSDQEYHYKPIPLGRPDQRTQNK
jgi:catechol 2,3-dioxygenase-like lactoylglutathione lyase family enzyme